MIDWGSSLGNLMMNGANAKALTSSQGTMFGLRVSYLIAD